MSKKIKEIFGKDSGVTLKNLEKAIKSDILHENDEIELTNADRFINEENLTISKEKRKENQTNKIVKELVSFLNSGRGVGLLFLGLEEIDYNIILKGVKTLKNKEQLRSTIYRQIGTIPANIKPFKLNIIPINYDNKNIFIVEVGSNDLDCLYYSKIDNNVYIRQGDEAKSLSIPDFLDLIANKNHPRIFIKLVELPNEDKNEYIFNIRLRNEGLEPGKYITSRLKITTSNGLKYNLSGRGISKHDIHLSEIDENNKIIRDGKVLMDNEEYTELSAGTSDYPQFIKGQKIHSATFSGTAGFMPNTMPIYPTLDGVIGKLTIEKKDFNMLIEVVTFESRGYTEQNIYLDSEKNKITIKEETQIFKPYLRL